jgi:hypothetical protein
MAGLRGMDVVADIVLLAAYFLFLISAKKHEINWGIVVTLFIFLFYLAYSLLIVYNNTRNAITLDFMIQIRPYLTFFIVSQMVHTFTGSQKRLLKRLCISMWIFFIPLGLYGLINPVAFADVAGSPANYVSSVLFLSLLYLYCSGFSWKERLIFLLMLSLGLIVVHAVFYAFYILTCLVLMYFHHPEIMHSKLRTGIAIALVLGATIYISESQITNYLSPQASVGSDYGFTARATLYQTAHVLLKDFFPLGSGFASFATYASKQHYSHIYSDYGLSSVNGLTPQEWFPVSDSYYPSLAQFGIVGVILYLMFWGYIVWLIFSRLRKKHEIQPFIVSLILISFVFIENIFDSFFTSNKGVFMMMFLGSLFGKPNATSAHRRRNRRFIPLETTQLADTTVPVDTAEVETREEEVADAKETVLTDAEEKTADTPAESVSAQSAPEVEEPTGSVEEDAEDEYDDFEEYCDEENDFDGEIAESQNTMRPANPAEEQDEAVADDTPAPDDRIILKEMPDIAYFVEGKKEVEETAEVSEDMSDDDFFEEELSDDDDDFRMDDMQAEAPQTLQSTSPVVSEPARDAAPQDETYMEKEFQEVLEKLKSRTEEKRSRPEKETGNTPDHSEKEGDSGRFDYII